MSSSLHTRRLLWLVAKSALDPRLGAKVDLSGVVQQTLLEAHQNEKLLADLPDPQRFAWLERALRNNLADEVRKFRGKTRDASREMAIDNGEEGSGHYAFELISQVKTPSSVAEHNELLRQMAVWMEELAEDEAQAIEMRYLQGLKIEEIARQMERTEGAVGSLLYRGLKKLREKSAKSDFADGDSA